MFLSHAKEGFHCASSSRQTVRRAASAHHPQTHDELHGALQKPIGHQDCGKDPNATAQEATVQMLRRAKNFHKGRVQVPSTRGDSCG